VPRVISFIVLLAVVLLVGAVFFQVMAQFLVPLFLACVLLVVFQPLHAWTRKRITTHQRLSALVTTVLILLVFLLPLAWLGWNAYLELSGLILSTSGRTKAVIGGPPVAVVIEENDEQDAPAKPELDWLHKAAFKVRDDIAARMKLRIEDETVIRVVNAIPTFVGVKVLSGVQSLIGILIGLAIMVIALYYFLADGPAMIRTAMDLSPLESRYEQELLNRFGEVSRAVVVATLLSAVVQGTLAGFGYFFALPSTAPIFLLTAATMVTSLVPFVGAAAVWICVCGWVFFYAEHVVDGKLVQGNPVAAILLAIYCAIVVSGIDNVIKPLILHGQSKLHPLLALLSILGGVQVLGPVGILVGPMLVSFLQALLTMLRKELDSFGAGKGSPAEELASLVEATVGATSAAQTPAIVGTSATQPAQPRGGRLKRKGR